MDVFGLEPIQSTVVIIAIIGVLLQVGIGALQSKVPFDGRNLVSTLLTTRNLIYSNVISCYLDRITSNFSFY